MVIAVASSAQTQSPPDFSGVYRPINAFGRGRAGGRGAARRRSARARAGSAAAAADAHRAALGRLAGPQRRRRRSSRLNTWRSGRR